jgi:tRNA pseudouridine55 synthase
MPKLMDGMILVDKRPGETSHDVVARIRRRLGRPRTGHAGTLDPFATGLLIVLVGRATRVQRFVMGLPKSYETVARLGAVSSTGDPEGEITPTGRVPPAGATLPTGRIRQRPPAYSAVKVGGERAYKRARRGEAVELPEREVVVTRFEELWRSDGDARAAYAIDCSSGTYVRSLIADLGDAYCEQLRRTAIGPFSVAEADDERLIGLGDGLARILPTVQIDGEQARRASHGRAVEGEAEGPVVLADTDGPIAVAEPREGGLLKPTVGFR